MSLTSVDAVAAMLRWSDAEKTKHQAQLLAYVAAASERVEADAGPFEARTVVHHADGGANLALPSRVLGIISVTVDGAELDASEWTVDQNAAIVYGPFAGGRGSVAVRYTTGFTSIPESAKLAATMVAADMWAIASQRAPSLDEQITPEYLMPKVVRDLLAPFRTMPGFA